MRARLRRGGAAFTSVLSISLMGSIALNVALISGCNVLKVAMWEGENPPAAAVDASEIRLSCMREAADAIGVKYNSGMTAGDIISEIRLTAKPMTFSGRALTEKEVKSASDMLDPAAEAALRENQKFLSAIEGKKLIVIEPLR